MSRHSRHCFVLGFGWNRYLKIALIPAGQSIFCEAHLIIIIIIIAHCTNPLQHASRNARYCSSVVQVIARTGHFPADHISSSADADPSPCSLLENDASIRGNAMMSASQLCAVMTRPIEIVMRQRYTYSWHGESWNTCRNIIQQPISCYLATHTNISLMFASLVAIIECFENFVI